MAPTATKTTALIAFTLPSTPYSVRIARFYVRAALNEHGLGEYATDAETVTSELVTNAITHAGGPAVRVEVLHLAGSGAVSVIVADNSPEPPVLRAPDAESVQWRGLHIVDALSARWGWTPQGAGKAVYAILNRKA